MRKFLTFLFLSAWLTGGLLFSAAAWSVDSNMGESNEIKFVSPNPADLAYPLVSKAAELDSPVAIYEYVRNNTEFALYHGARSGSINTFLGGRGNDVDQAATLIAMLRAQGYPARYAVATIQLPSSKVMNWLKVKNADLAYGLLRDQGIQNASLSADKTIINMEHTWVETLVPYGNYRGAGNSNINCVTTPSSCNWVSLDPSFKQHEFQASGIDPYTALNFDYSAYYDALKNNDSARRDKNPLEIYENQVLNWLRANSATSGKTLEDIADFGDIVAQEDGLLPASLPFMTVGTVRRYNSAKDHDDAIPADGGTPVVEAKNWTKYVTVVSRFVISSPDFNAIATPHATVSLVDASTQRFTFTFQTDATGKYMVYRLGGAVTGNFIQISESSGGGTLSVPLGTPFSITVTMDGSPAPDGNGADKTITATYSAVAGGYYLIATGGETSNWSQVHRASQQLLDANRQYPTVFNPSDPGENGQPCDPLTGLNCTPYVDGNANGWDAADTKLLENNQALDGLTGGLLYVAGTQYYAKMRESLDRLDGINKTKTPILGFLGVVSSTHEVEYIDGTAFSVLPGGLLIDMKGISILGSWRIDQPSNYSNSQFELFGHVASSLEHEVWQELTGYDAISTVRGIQMALATNASTSLTNPKRNTSEDSLPGLYPTYGYSTTAPSGWTKNTYKIFGQDYVAWSNPDITAAFNMFTPDTQGILNVNDPKLVLFSYFGNNNRDGTLSIYKNIYDDFVSRQAAAATVPTNIQLTLNSSTFQTADVIASSLTNSPNFVPSALAYSRVGASNSSQYNFFVNATSALADGNYNTTVNAVLSNKDGGIYRTIGTASYNPPTNSNGVTITTPGFSFNNYSYNTSAKTFTFNLLRTSAADGTYNVGVRIVMFSNGNIITANTSLNGVQVLNGRIVLGTLSPQFTYTVRNNSNLTCNGTTYTNQTPTVLLNHLQTCFNSYVAANTSYFSLVTPSSNLRFRAIPPSGVLTDNQFTSKIVEIRNDLNGRDVNQSWVEYLIPSKLSVGANYRFSVDIRKAYDTATGYYTSATYGIQNNGGISAGGGYVTAATVLKQASSIQVIGSPTSVLPTFNNATLTDQNIIAEVNNDPIKTPSSADPVSTVTGNNYHDETDLTIKGRNGLHYVFTRTYNSAPSSTKTDIGLGYGWVHSYGMRLKSNDYGNCPNCPTTQTALNGNNTTSSITYTDERGGDHNYLVSETTFAVTPPAGEFDSLAFDTPVAGQHTLTFRNGTKYIFETVGTDSLKSKPNLTARLKQIADAYGNQLNFSYNANGRLATVTDNLGISGRTGLVFAYDANNHLQQVSDWRGRNWNYVVDANGNLTSTSNPLSQTRTYAYTPSTHNLITVAQPLARNGIPVQTSFSYYRNGRTFNDANALGDTETLDYDLYRSTTRVTDPRGGVREYQYDSSGRMTQLTEPDGAILQFSNNPDGLRNTKTDGLGYKTQYSYKADKSIGTASDTFGNVTREQDALNQTVDTSYGIYDQVATVKDKRGTIATTSFHTTNDGSCKVIGKPDTVTLSQLTNNGIATPNVKLKSYCWNTDGSSTSVTEYIDSAASTYRRTSTTYDSAHLNPQQVTVSGSDGLSVSRTYTYDNLGRKLTETLNRRTSPTNPAMLTLTTSYEYDALDRVTAVIDALGNRMETVFDANGQISQQIARYKKTDGSFNTRILSTRSYDAADRLLTDTNTLGGITRYTYDEAGNLSSVTDPENHTTTYQYDEMNRRTAVIDGNDHRITTDYDLAGRAVSITNPNQEKIHQTYDNLGRVTQITDALGNITQTQYDANNNVTCVIDANAVANLQPKNNDGCTVSTQYDELNRPTQTKDAQNRITKTTYDLLGNIISITDPKNRITSYSYDKLGRLTQTTDPLNKTTTTLRDEAGNAYQVTNRLNEITRISYDKLNRPIRSDYLKDNSAQTTDYDIYGNVIGQANNTVGYGFTYDPLNRLSSKIDSRGKALAFTYDKTGRILSKNTYQNSTTQYTYDGTGRLAAITNPDTLNVNYQFDGAGRLLSRVMSSGAKSLYQYDANGQLTQLTHTDAKGNPLTNISTTRDKVGNILTQTDSSGTTTYTYDPLYRLLTVDAPSTQNDEAYTYDEVGNRLSHTQGSTVANANTRYYDYLANSNRLSQIHIGSPSGTVESAFTYDFEGRLIQQTGLNARTLTWDAKGRLKTLTHAGITETYAYDPTDHRIKRSGGHLGNLDYYLEGEHLESVDSDGQTIEKYFRGASVDELVAGYISNGTSSLTPVLYQHDLTMGVAAISDVNGGAIQTNRYSPFGTTQNTTGNSTNRLKYTGREDDGNGCYYYRARYYCPDIGRFISEDPLQFQAGINFYAYVDNNPVNANDPSGMELVMVNLPATGGAMGSFFFDREIAPSMVGFVNQLRNSNIPVTVNLAFRTTAEQAALYANRSSNPNPVAMPGTSRHEGGFAIDLNGIRDLSAEKRNMANEIASSYGLSPIAKDPPHFQADAVTYGYVNRADAIKTNQLDYSLGLPLQNSNFNFSIPFYTQPTVCCSINPTSGQSIFSTDLNFSFNSSFGGFLLYPNKLNNNQLRNVYSK